MARELWVEEGAIVDSDGNRLNASALHDNGTYVPLGPAASGDTTGVTDVAALQAKFDAAYANYTVTGAVTDVLLRAGTYWINASLRLRRGVRVIGGGKFATTLKAATTNTAHMVTLYDTDTYWSWLSDVSIDGNRDNNANVFDGIRLQGSMAAYSASSVPAAGAVPPRGPDGADLTWGGWGTFHTDTLHTFENIVIGYVTGNGFYCDSLVEGRVKDVYALWCGQACFNIHSSYEWHIEQCVSLNNGLQGYVVSGNNHIFDGCSAYWAGRTTALSGVGWDISGGGHTLSGCLIEDTYGDAIVLQSGATGIKIDAQVSRPAGNVLTLNGVSGCDIRLTLARSSGSTNNARNVVEFVGASNLRNRVVVNSYAGTAQQSVAGNPSGNTVIIDGQDEAVSNVAYAATISVDPFTARRWVVGTLTGNISVKVVPARFAFYKGMRVAFIFTQDGTGGRTITFTGPINVTWTPDTTASRVNTIELLYDGAKWLQVGAVTGITVGSVVNVADSFDRTDSASTLGSADTGQAWSALSGTWGISSNKGYLASAQGNSGLAALDLGAADASAWVEITFSAVRVSAGVVMRVVDNNNHLVAVATKNSNTDNLVLYKRVAGTFTALATVSAMGWVLGATYLIQTVSAGSAITVLVNGVSKIAYTLTAGEQATFLTPTKFGIRAFNDSNANGGDSGTTRYDNLAVVAG